MFEIWETNTSIFDNDGVSEPIAQVATCLDYDEAVAILRQCQRPTVDLFRRVNGTLYPMSYVL